MVLFRLPLLQTRHLFPALDFGLHESSSMRVRGEFLGLRDTKSYCCWYCTTYRPMGTKFHVALPVARETMYYTF